MNGKVVFSTMPQQQGENLNDKKYFLAGKSNTYLEDIYFLPYENRENITITTPIINNNGVVISVLGIHLNLSSLTQIISNSRALEKTGKTHLIDRFGFSISTSDLGLNTATFENILTNEIINLVISRNDGRKIYLNYNNEANISAYGWIEDLNLGLIVEMPQKSALISAQKLAWDIVSISIIFCGISTLLVSLLAQEITKPILIIKDAAVEVTKGNLNVILPILTEDEVGVLAQAFNEMIEELNFLYDDFQEQINQLELAEISAIQTYHDLGKEKKKVELISKQLTLANQEIKILNNRLKAENLDLTVELKAINQRLNHFLDAIPVGIIVFDIQGNIYYANNKAKDLLGQQLRLIKELYLANTNDKYPESQALGVKSLQLGISNHVDDIEIHTEEKIIPLEAWETPIFNDLGQVNYAIVAFQDITERRENEKERQKFIKKIVQINRANERFVPRELLKLLQKKSIKDVKLGDNIEREMTVLFCDIRDFTQISENMNPTDNFRFINAFLSRLSPCINKYHGFIDKYIGDSIMALFSENADDAIMAGISMLNKLKKYNDTRQRPKRLPIEIGIGINTGLMMLGTVGSNERMDGTVISDSVNLASRLENLTKLYGVSLLISHYTFLMLKDSEQYCLRLVDKVKVKGKSVPVGVYEIFDADPLSVKEHKLATKTLFEQGISLYHLGDIKSAAINFEQCININPDDKLSHIYLQRCYKNEN